MRDAFHEDLDRISDTLVEMTRLVGSAMSRATTALLDADLELAESVITADEKIDRMRKDLDDLSVELLARQQPVATDLRMVVTAMRMSADLERMGDLARHVAKVCRLRYPEAAVPAELRAIILEMGHVAEEIVAETGQVVSSKDTDAAARMDTVDDKMDALHRRLYQSILDDSWDHGVQSAVDATLVGRYYERFGDHAVSVAHRVVYLVTGEWEDAATEAPQVAPTA